MDLNRLRVSILIFDAIIRALISACAAACALRFFDDSNVIDLDCGLRTYILARSTSNTLISVNLCYQSLHLLAGGKPLVLFKVFARLFITAPS